MKLHEDDFKELLSRALEVRKNAYAPYSNYAVGAAIMSSEGEIFTGANVENAAFAITICAERSAIFNAVSNGVRQFKAIVVVTENGGVSCGACRQALSEFANSAEVIIVNDQGEIVLETTVSKLLPYSFGQDDLSV